MDCCPHVARFRDRVVGEHTCSADEARRLVASLRALLPTLIPVPLSQRMASKSVRTFSERIGHDMSYRLTWR